MSPDAMAQIQEKSLDRHLQWITAADNKAMSVLAFNAAVLGAIGFMMPSFEGRTSLDTVVLLLAALFPAMAIFQCSQVVFPRLTGPENSLIYFGGVATFEQGAYIDAIKSLTDQNYIHDLMKQCHRNAEIAAMKYQALRKAFLWMYLGIPICVACTYYFTYFTPSAGRPHGS